MSTLSDRELFERALRARESSYSPYSHHPVGAALLAESGRVYTGTNVENASYSLSICAERVALFSAITAGERTFMKLAIAGPEGVKCPPCGACRQALYEFAPELEIIMGTRPDDTEVDALRDLLPRAFRL